MERKKKSIIKEAIQLGGSDFDIWSQYTRPSEQHYSNDPHHLERSCHHQPNHKKCKKNLGVQTEASMRAIRTQRWRADHPKRRKIQR